MAVVKAPPTFMFPFMMSPFSDADLFLSRTADYIQQAITSPIIKPNSPRLRHLKDKQAIVDVLRRLYDTDNPEPKEGRTLYVWLLESFQQNGACGLCPFFAELNKRREASQLPALLDDDERRIVATILLYVLSENHDIKPAHWEGLFSDLIDIEAGDKPVLKLSKARLPRMRMESANTPVDKAFLNSANGDRVLLAIPYYDERGRPKAYISVKYNYKDKLMPHDANVLLTAFNVASQNEIRYAVGGVNFIKYLATHEAIAKSYFPNAKEIGKEAIETVKKSLERLATTTISDIDAKKAMEKGYIPKDLNLPSDSPVPFWPGRIVLIDTGEHKRGKRVNSNGRMVVTKSEDRKIVEGWEITNPPILFQLSDAWKRIRRCPPTIRPNSIGYGSDSEAIYATMSNRIFGVSWKPISGKIDVGELLDKSFGELSHKQRRTRTETIEKVLVYWETIGLCSAKRFRSKQGISKADYGKTGRLDKFEISLPTRDNKTGKPFDTKDPKWKHKAEKQMRDILQIKDEEYL